MSAGVAERATPARIPQTRIPQVRKEPPEEFKCQTLSTRQYGWSGTILIWAYSELAK
jgi:hypothetical protein